MRLIDAIQGFPAILSALLFAAVFAPGIGISMVAIGIAFVPAFARLTRAGFLELRAREFVVAARALGARPAADRAAHLAEHARAAHRPGDDQLSDRDSGRGRPRVSRARNAAAASPVGTHAARGPELPVDERVVRRVPGRRDRPDGARAQPAGRRAP